MPSEIEKQCVSEYVRLMHEQGEDVRVGEDLTLYYQEWDESTKEFVNVVQSPDKTVQIILDMYGASGHEG